MTMSYEKAPRIEVEAGPTIVVGRGGVAPMTLTPIAAYELAKALLEVVAALYADDAEGPTQ